MPSKKPVDVLLGTHTIGDVTILPGVIHFDKEKEVADLLDALSARGYRQIDTARNYPGAEARLGDADAASRFTMHTKILSMQDGDLELAKVHASIEASLADLKVSHVETVFLHVPDRQTPFEETARAMDEARRQGKFSRFGLSNYTAAEVQRYIEVCEQHGYTKPSVYEGHYNALVRGGEKELLPLLRQHNMSFFAYSPAAGGLSPTTPPAPPAGNQVGERYNRIYGHPALQASVASVQEVAKKHGVDGHSVALRWARFHSALDSSYGDGVIFAVSKMEQLPKTLDALEAGPLPDELAALVSAIYKTVEGPGEPAYHL